MNEQYKEENNVKTTETIFKEMPEDLKVNLAQEAKEKELKVKTMAQTQAYLAKKPVGEGYSEELNQITLSELEREQVNKLKETIKISDVRAISEYGVGIQQNLGGFSDKLLNNVTTKETGEVGELLDDLLGDLSTVEASDLNKKSNFIAKMFRKASNKTSAILSQYQTVSVKVEKTSIKLREIQIGLQDDINTLSNLAEQNRQYGRAVKLYIIAGEEKLSELRTKDLPQAQEKATKGDLDDQQALQRLINDINRLEKRVFDLQTSKTITLQTEPQIDMIRNTSLVLVEKINSSISTVIPLWKNQLTIALTLRNQANGAKAQESINKATNELLKRNSEMLKTNTISVAEQAEKGIIDVETLEITQNNLVETIKETLRIQKEGSINRQKAKERMVEMEAELKQQLHDLAKEAGNDYGTETKPLEDTNKKLTVKEIIDMSNFA